MNNKRTTLFLFSTIALALMSGAVVFAQEAPGNQDSMEETINCTDRGIAAEQEGEYSYDRLQRDPQLMTQLQRLDPDFTLDSVGVSAPLINLRMDDGSEFEILRGCTANSCGGSIQVIVHDRDTDEVYILKQVLNDDGTLGMVVLGEPDQRTDVLLTCFLLRWANGNNEVDATSSSFI